MDPLEDIAPYPGSTSAATAEAMWRHHAARALYNSAAAWAFLEAGDAHRYELCVSTSAADLNIALLIRSLLAHAPEAADQAARGLYTAQSAGEAVQEWAIDWLTSVGVDTREIYRRGRQPATNTKEKEPTP